MTRSDNYHCEAQRQSPDGWIARAVLYTLCYAVIWHLIGTATGIQLTHPEFFYGNLALFVVTGVCRVSLGFLSADFIDGHTKTCDRLFSVFSWFQSVHFCLLAIYSCYDPALESLVLPMLTVVGAVVALRVLYRATRLSSVGRTIAFNAQQSHHMIHDSARSD